MSDDVIERVLFISSVVHVYMIPPMSSNRGHIASNWTKPPSKELFVEEAHKISPRLRVIERSPVATADGSQSPKISVSILLESPSNGELFAAAPYTNPNTVMQAADSARFFALTVVDSGRKAVLGIGFEERSEAFDFGVALQEARKALQWDTTIASGSRASTSSSQKSQAANRNWSLKDGETLHIEVPKSKIRRNPESSQAVVEASPLRDGAFSGLLPPPPSAAEVKEERRKSKEIIEDAKKKELADLGFDDGEFGEFQ